MYKISKILRFIFNHPLARKHKIKALYRFVRWQLSQSINPRLVKYPFVESTRLWASKGMEAATANIYTGLHEFNEMAFLIHFLREEDMFVDIGANIGAYTMLASGVVGCRSISIEPLPLTFQTLQNNIDLNSINDKVKALNMGVGTKKSSLFFTDNKSSGNHVVMNVDDFEGGLINVPVNSLDNILHDQPCPSLIKIDVEGFEQEVINGALNVLSHTNLKAVIIELIGEGKRYGFDEDNIHEQLLGFGFKVYGYYPFNRKLSPINIQSPSNKIYLRDIDFVERRLLKARRVKVFSEVF